MKLTETKGWQSSHSSESPLLLKLEVDKSLPLPVLVLHEDSLRGSQVDWRYAIFCVKLWLRKSLVGGSNTVAAMLRLLLPLLLQWTAGEVQIPTVEIAKGVQMPVMSIGLPQVMFCTFRANANSLVLIALSW